jgi:hypothetical protein
MKKVEIKGFPYILAYEKDDIQTAILCSVLGVSEWVMENLAQTCKVTTHDFPAEQEEDIKWDGDQYRGKKTGKKFDKYVQITFPGKEIPKDEDEGLRKNELFSDMFYEASNNVLTYRFQCPDSLDIEDSSEDK